MPNTVQVQVRTLTAPTYVLLLGTHRQLVATYLGPGDRPGCSGNSAHIAAFEVSSMDAHATYYDRFHRRFSHNLDRIDVGI